ncbi:hypothetical protein BJY24_005736 [Nocardia transvalensis]|uniref:Uncharacterized protein n=1 Tax=Nocardia transvalensis TaxID=37333 RepID=A0A7W9PIJ2_9NOCA|nr:hypothetical protein [Nocardia transvalensis]MBB5916824.1 hypothetical protein [Nocardia transvalensis]
MSPVTAGLVAGVCGAIFVAVAALMLCADRGYERSLREAPTQILAIIDRTHDAPDTPPSVPEAHRDMQRHRLCAREDCPRKRIAYQVLVDAGHLTPDSGRIP